MLLIKKEKLAPLSQFWGEPFIHSVHTILLIIIYHISLKAYSRNVDDNGNMISQIGSETLSNVSWESSDENIAEVDSNGNVNFKSD